MMGSASKLQEAEARYRQKTAETETHRLHRNQAIRDAIHNGMRPADAARITGLTPGRIAQITKMERTRHREPQNYEREFVRNPRLAFNATEADCCSCVNTCDERTDGICRCLPK